MKTRLLGLAVVMVALAVIVNALALSSASVTNKLSIPVTTTDTALIAFEAPTTPDADITLTAVGANQMTVSVDTGIQPNSTYVFDQVFAVTNNSGNAVTLGVTYPATTGLTITLANAAGGADLNGLSLGIGASVNVKMTVVAAAGAASLVNGDLIISATRP